MLMKVSSLWQDLPPPPRKKKKKSFQNEIWCKVLLKLSQLTKHKLPWTCWTAVIYEEAALAGFTMSSEDQRPGCTPSSLCHAC